MVVCIHQALTIISVGLTWLTSMNWYGIAILGVNLLISIPIFMKLSISKFLLQLLCIVALIAICLQIVAGFQANLNTLAAAILFAVLGFYIFLFRSVNRYIERP